MNISKKIMVLFLLALVFAAPGATAYLFYHHTEWLGDETTNKGELLTPPIHLAFLQKSKWKLVLWIPGACHENCAHTMDKLARIRLALGRRLYEVEAVLIQNQHVSQLSPMVMQRFLDEDIQTLSVSPLEAKVFVPWKQKPMIFIINPENYLILAYADTAQPKDIFLDIKHLLHLKE